MPPDPSRRVPDAVAILVLAYTPGVPARRPSAAPARDPPRRGCGCSTTPWTRRRAGDSAGRAAAPCGGRACVSSGLGDRPRGSPVAVDQASYTSKAQGLYPPFGLRLAPLSAWIAQTRDVLKPGTAWAVAPLARWRATGA